MKRITSVIFSLLLAGCGGGGGSDGAGSTSAASYTYFKQGGLTWSSTSLQTYFYVPLGSTSIPLDQGAGYFCNGSKNGVIDNFNKEAGWRLPTYIELQNLYKEMPSPQGWVIGRVWASSGIALDFSTGGGVGGGTPELTKFYVSCVHE